jgi:hypothetical protein
MTGEDPLKPGPDLFTSRTHAVLDQFERDWKEGRSPAIEPLLEGVEPERLWPRLSELILADRHHRERTGQPWTCGDY